jgi:predicted metal-dependent hydrolase
MAGTPAPDRVTALKGFERAFGEGRYFDAHEILEAYWVSYRGPDRELYRGLIQAAVALHHARGGNVRGARGVGGRARRNIARYAPEYEGIDVAAYLRRLDEEIP